MTLEILTSDELAPFRHGFFTRKGGASSGIFQGLNCGYGSTDQKEIVTTNRRRVAEAMGLSYEHLLTVHQIHSAEVVTVTSNNHDRPKADAMVTAVPGLALGVLTADCQPVLFGDAENGVIGAAHAGWPGALGGVLEATIEAMEALGAERDSIRATIGPTISQGAYEVGPEYVERFLDNDPENSRFFAGSDGDRAMFDLPAYGLNRLRQAGIKADWNRHCTYQASDKFYSYRRSVHQKEADYGRQISVIRL